MAAGEGSHTAPVPRETGRSPWGWWKTETSGTGPYAAKWSAIARTSLDRVRARPAHLDPARYLRREAKKCTRWTTIEMAHVNVPEVMLPGRVGETLEANLAYLHERRWLSRSP
jgi:hypothetical protein